MNEPTRLVTGPQAREEARDAAEPTELAATETETASVRAWGLDEGTDEPTTRLTPGRITGAAVSASLLALAAVGLMAWQLRADTVTPEAVSSSMVPATMTTAAPVAVTPPPLPAPPPVTITTVIKQVPAPTSASPPSRSALPPAVVDAYDRKLIAGLQSQGWSVWDSAELTGQAHDVCGALEQGRSPQSIVAELSGPQSPTSAADAQVFVSAVMATYPDCP